MNLSVAHPCPAAGTKCQSQAWDTLVNNVRICVLRHIPGHASFQPCAGRANRPVSLRKDATTSESFRRLLEPLETPRDNASLLRHVVVACGPFSFCRVSGEVP